MPLSQPGRKRFRIGWSWSRSIQLFLLISFSLSGLLCRSAQAIDRATLLLLTTPLEPTLFQRNVPLPDNVITPDRISQTGLTPPSLWWTSEQFGNELLSYWLAYPGSADELRRVDLLVDSQRWNTANYVRRYTFLNQFGTAAKAFGYNTRVFNLQGDLLGAYICEPIPNSDSTVRNNRSFTCSIFLNPYGRGALSGSNNPNPFGEAVPTEAGPGLD